MSGMYLTDDDLGTLDLGPMIRDGGRNDCNENGYVVSDWTIGFPAVREVARNRALADGTVDDTRFVGARAITVNVSLDVSRGDPQLMVDALMPYLSPRRRPRLHWTLPGSTQERSIVVRGADGPVSVSNKFVHTAVCSWVGPGGLIESGGLDPNCEIINPSSDTEDGRDYGPPMFAEDEFGPYYTNTSGVVDRAYPDSLGIGDRLIENRGNAVTDWTASIFGAATNPALIINGIPIRFDRQGGLDVTGGTSVVIDSRERTILLNGDPMESRYDKVNFEDWSWEQVRLQPGDNIVRFEGDVLSEQASVQICWRDAWL